MCAPQYLAALLLLLPCIVCNGDDNRMRLTSIPQERLQRKHPILGRIVEERTSDSSRNVINVDDYGAKGIGTDDTQAFKDAWNDACSNSSSVFLVPSSKAYQLKQIIFSGPCKSGLTVEIAGDIVASSSMSDWDGLNRQQWIVFRNLENFRVHGGGTINGNGEVWWNNSCKINKALPCKIAPTALTFYSIKQLMVDNLKIRNSQQMHVTFEKCEDVQASHFIINAPEDSPNTDGIHVAATQNMLITSSSIGTGDDCISIVAGAKNISAFNITCGPGHGISIGSLGAQKQEDHVSNILVNGARLLETTNGVRIKTWPGGQGSATNIKFSNIEMKNVQNPIIIDQNYCDSKENCLKGDSEVSVQDITYKSIKGTSSSLVAIKFSCSDAIPCQGISLEDINLTAARGAATKSLCNNVEGTSQDVVPTPCI